MEGVLLMVPEPASAGAFPAIVVMSNVVALNHLLRRTDV